MGIKARPFCYRVAPKSESIVVVGAGPSVTDNIGAAAEYARENKSIVLCANYYERAIDYDYIVYVDVKKYKETIPTLPESKIIAHRGIPLSDRVLKKHKIWRIALNIKKKHLYVSRGVRFPSDGKFPYCSLGNAGFTSALMSAYFKPKKVLLVGFDGPIFKKDGSPKSIAKDDGRFHNFVNLGRAARKVKHFRSRLIPFLKSKGIVVQAFSNDNLWGINRREAQIEDIG